MSEYPGIGGKVAEALRRKAEVTGFAQATENVLRYGRTELDRWADDGGSVAADARTTRESDASAWERDLDMRGWG